ncbi:hypothetical protein, partial [Nostoc sp. UHCC 0251]|uniref:hypothetical protein n=1 Tax=Nostoc sp. UHCC 0251 TaxID=3110240 RepID=UPI002B1FCCD4
MQGLSTASTAARKSKGASALGGSADLFAQRLRQEKQLAFKSQKSKLIQHKRFIRPIRKLASQYLQGFDTSP